VTQCEEWRAGRQRGKAEATQRIQYPTEFYRIRFLAHWIATSITYQQTALLWITELHIWPSSENWHLYYKLRQSYGDLQLLEEAPGHLFLPHEAEDLASFLQIAMLNGWGGYVLTEANYVHAFFSHDEFVDFSAEHDANLDEVRKAWCKGAPGAK